MSLLERVGGPGFDASIKRLTALSPALADLVVTFPYGEVLSRPGLDLRTRQACTVAILLANGSAQGQLRFHMAGLLNVGGSVDDLVELLTMATGVLGFPAAIDGIGILREIVKDKGIAFQPASAAPAVGPTRFERGVAALRTILGMEPARYTQAFADTSPALARLTVEFEFGDVLAREQLDRKTARLAAIVMLAASGNRARQLGSHIAGALQDGVTQDEVAETIIQLAAYAGFPTALNAAFTAIEALRGQDRDERASTGQVAFASGDDADHDDRRTRGLATLKATSGKAGDAIVHSFDDLAPHIGALIVDHSYGDIFARPGLDPRTRELTACAALAGNMTVSSEAPLRVHIAAALAVGVSRAEIVETLLNVAPYRGFPAIQRAMAIAGEEFQKSEQP